MGTIQAVLDQKGPHVVTCSPDQTVIEAVRSMVDDHVGGVVVILGEKVVGMFTERDLMCRVIVKGRPTAETKVGEVMSSPVICCKPSTPTGEVRALVRQKRIRHVPVVDDEQKLVGIVSIGDLNVVHEKVQEETIQYLERYMYKP